MNFSVIAAIALAAISAAGCTRQADTPVPKRTAYPRPFLYPDTTVTAAVGGLAFDIKAAADTTRSRENWLDISYPRYNAVIHIGVRALSSDAELDEAIANRMERIALNLGDRNAVVSDFVNPAGFTCRTVTSTDGGPVPVQFMAYSAERLLSGAVTIEGPSEPADSIAPTVRSLATDVEILLKSLRSAE